MAIRELKDQIARLPEQPGVYLYFNAAGETIYVGKARALRDRVRNYLGAYGTNPKTDALLDEIARLEVIVTDSVVEALALENNLIKQRSPKYNILLRDDKNYPYLQLTTNEAFPRVLVARRVERDGSFYAGPFMPARFARKTMALTHRLFGIRSCNEVITGKRDRPCLEYDIKRCIAPCVDSRLLGRRVRRGRRPDAAVSRRQERRAARRRCRRRWSTPPTAERFEEAAQLRDAMRTIQTLHDRQQKMATTELGHRDVFGLKLGPAGAVVQVFQVRRGRVVERIELGTDAVIAAAGPGEVLEAAIQQFYEDRDAPREVHVPERPRTNARRSRAGCGARPAARCGFVVPQRGEKRGLVDLATRNAALAYQTRFNQGTAAAVRRARDAACGAGAAGIAAPHRVLRHLDDPGQRDGRVDGGLRGRPDASAVSTASFVSASWTARPRGFSTILRRCARSWGAAIGRCSNRAARSRTWS